tara:strand:- start:242 stop:589 length:348 start_codon:yes stop_codon:yes gene_type:complete
MGAANEGLCGDFIFNNVGIRKSFAHRGFVGISHSENEPGRIEFESFRECLIRRTIRDEVSEGMDLEIMTRKLQPKPPEKGTRLQRRFRCPEGTGNESHVLDMPKLLPVETAKEPL